MTAMWDKLVAILLETLSIYEILLDLSKAKREILVQAKPKELELITKQEEAIILKAGKIEAVRVSVITELANVYGIESNEISLSNLVKSADSKTSQQLNEINGNLDRVLHELEKNNKINVELISQSLNFVNYNINILAQTMSEPTYAPQGQSNQAGTSKTIFDAKV